MSTVFYDVCEENIALFEYVHGTDFNGVEYFEEVNESIGLFHSSYVVYVDEIAEELNLGVDFTPSHAPYCILSEELDFLEMFGQPVDAYQATVQVLHSAFLSTIETCAVIVEVIHGVETYYEEISSGLHSVDWNQAVNYHFQDAYESFGIKMEPWDGRTDLIVKFNFYFNDLINFRHSVFQQYNFNSRSNDNIGMSSKTLFGYHKILSSFLQLNDAAHTKMGNVAREYIVLSDEDSRNNWSGGAEVHDEFMVYDYLSVFRGYLIDVGSDLEFSVDMDLLAYMIHVIGESLHIHTQSTSPSELYHTLLETLRVTSGVAIVAAHEVVVGDAIEVNATTGDVHIVSESVDSELEIATAHQLLNIYVSLLNEEVEFIVEGGFNGS